MNVDHKVCVTWADQKFFSKPVRNRNGVLILFERVQIEKEFLISQEGENKKNVFE